MSTRVYAQLVLTAATLAVCPVSAVALERGRASDPAPPRVWLLAHAGRAGCTATVDVRAGRRTQAVSVRGTHSRRYLTTLRATPAEKLASSQSPGDRCRAIVEAVGSRGRRSLKPRSRPQRGRRGVLTVASGGEQPTGVLTVASGGEQPTGELPSRPAQGGETSLPATGKVLGTFDVVGAAQMQAWAAAGGTAVVVPVIWADAQPTQEGKVTLESAGNDGQNVLTEIAQAHAAHLQVFLELDLQYPPDWVKRTTPEYVDQAGTAFSSAEPGRDVRDWVWSQTGRNAVASFVAGAIGALQPELEDIAGIRAGGGMWGEMQYPSDGSTIDGQPSYWGYDTPAQTGAGLASGEQSSRLPGYVYGQGSAAEDSTWAAWYLQSLGNFVHWYVLQLRQDGWQGPVYVLHPSYGLRDKWSPRSPEYEQQLAQGTDFAVQMDAYDKLADVWPWSTWADDAEPYYHPGDTVNSDMAAWRELLVLAQERGLASHIMGENTGGGGTPAIERLAGGAVRAGYQGIFYMDYPALIAGGGSLLSALTSTLVEQLSSHG